MYTIKQAAQLTGVPETSLRAWERRYAVVAPRRTDAGYRVYDDDAVALVATMRCLVDAGWAPAEAARAVRDDDVPTPMPVPADVRALPRPADAATYMERFLAAAARMDATGIEENLDRAFALGSFEHVVDSWLLPTLEALGEGWSRGEIDVAGEHAASHAVLRRLSASFQAAASSTRGPRVVVGLPPGSGHELGALAYATALRRRGLNVLYLGTNVPELSWGLAVATHRAQAAVLAVPTAEDRKSAAATARSLLAGNPGLVVGSGGAFGNDLVSGAHSLPQSIGRAAQELDRLLQGDL
ncbi:MAG TPA: MerR family transcriptional regulator [Nocardioidaceae bacterium]|nr:MerR family transcriptional regulator [Nocardioidaceae bacterium]